MNGVLTDTATHKHVAVSLASRPLRPVTHAQLHRAKQRGSSSKTGNSVDSTANLFSLPVVIGQPGMGQVRMGQPGMGQAGMGQPGMGQPGMGQPGMGQPGMSQAGMGQPGMGQAGMGQMGMGQTGLGQVGMPPQSQPGTVPHSQLPMGMQPMQGVNQPQPASMQPGQQMLRQQQQQQPGGGSLDPRLQYTW